MQTKDLSMLAKAIAPVIQEHIKSQRDDIVKSVLSSIPAPEPVIQLSEDDVKRIASGLIVEPEKVDLEVIAKSAALLVEIPKVKDGEDGKDAVIDCEKIDDLVAKHVAQFEINEESIVNQVLSAIPAPTVPAVPTVEEIVSVVAAQFERRFSDLQLSWERQASDKFEKAIDKMPKPKDGVDAIPLESFDIELGEDGRTLTVKMQAGESLLSKSIKIPSVIDRGVYKSGRYDKGDGVTYGGSFWIAQESGDLAAPGTVEAKSHWRLAVKKGRDGSDLRENAATIDVSKGVKIR